jgi:hypothetical protein
MNKLHLNHVMIFPPPDPYNICTDLHFSFELLSFSSQEFQFDILQDFYVIIELVLHILHCLPYFISFSFAFYLKSFRCLFMFSLVSLIILFHSTPSFESILRIYCILQGSLCLFFSYFLCFFSGICTS